MTPDRKRPSRYLVVGPNQCCGCSTDTFVGLFATLDEAEAARLGHDDRGVYDGSYVIDLHDAKDSSTPGQAGDAP